MTVAELAMTLPPERAKWTQAAGPQHSFRNLESDHLNRALFTDRLAIGANRVSQGGSHMKAELIKRIGSISVSMLSGAAMWFCIAAPIYIH